MSTLGNAARKYIYKLQVQQICIIRIMTKFFLYLDQTSSHLQPNKPLKIPSTYKLEVLKIMQIINAKTLPNYVGDFLQIFSKTHYYPT